MRNFIFYKYPSMENHYRKKEIEKNLRYNPEMKNEKYIAQLKTDGSNVALYINTNTGETRWAKRSCLLEENPTFQGLDTVLKDEEFKIFTNELIGVITKNYKKTQMIFYGELFGTGIQKRINYGKRKFVQFYDIRIDDKMISPMEFYLIRDTLVASVGGWVIKYFVPIYETFSSLDEALEFDVENIKINNYNLTENGEDYAEGIVIKPFCIQNTRFYIKKKSQRFADKSESKKRKSNGPITEEMKATLNYQTKFMEYINENRVLDMVSKEGSPDKKEYGSFIKKVIEDAWIDFIKDNNLSGEFINENKKQIVKKAGGHIIRWI